ncbi:RNA polymerase sigma factor [Streptomyces chartreusis]|uniref:RNA polymerase sigma factor n=1 Tax=Streptomyces chartreusis TaxID=1969 RepID=UPI0037F7E122
MTAREQGEGRTDDPRAALYRAHHARLVGYIKRRVGDLGEAESLAHEAWLAFLLRFDHYQEKYDEPVAPLFVIANRKVTDWYADRKKLPDLPGDDGLDERLAKITQNRQDQMSRADLRMDLKAGIARLTPRQREALVLRYVDDLGRPTVAELMGITVEGVKKLIGTALNTLRTAHGLADYVPQPTTTSSTRKEVRK